MKITPLEATMAGKLGTDPGQPLSPEDILNYQLDRLAETVAYARRHSAFYRGRLADMHLPDSAAAHSFQDLPFTTEEELRRYGREMLCISQDEVARIITMHSSGTTGEPKRLFFSEDDLEQTLDFFHHGMESLAAPGDSVLILLPGATPDSTGDLLARALTRMGADSRIHGLIAHPEAAAREIFTSHFAVVVGLPVQVLALARCAAALHLDTSRVRSVLLCSDYIPQTLNAALTGLWNCRVFSHYGTVETGLGGGVECEARAGCHLRETDLFFEVISPQTGEVQPPGAFGEIVFSTLNRRAMPLLRYRTGDYGRLLPGACPCGSNIRRLDQVRGRISQVQQLENGCYLAMADLDEALLSIAGLLDVQATLHEADTRDRLTLRLTVIPGQTDSALAEAAFRLQRLESLHDIPVSLEVNATPSIQQGKRIITDKRRKQHHEKTH